MRKPPSVHRLTPRVIRPTEEKKFCFFYIPKFLNSPRHFHGASASTESTSRFLYAHSPQMRHWVRSMVFFLFYMDVQWKYVCRLLKRESVLLLGRTFFCSQHRFSDAVVTFVPSTYMSPWPLFSEECNATVYNWRTRLSFHWASYTLAMEPHRFRVAHVIVRMV